LTYAGTSTLSAAALTALLRTSSLPGLLHQTSKLLSASYSIFAQAFDNLEIEYIPATVGLFVFARIANSKSIEEDKQLTADLESQGLCFSPGWLYDEHCSESGWRRITIAVSEETAVEAVSRLKSYLQCGSQKNC
jgi:aspartate/methionine/tyrosine aminotransferase